MTGRHHILAGSAAAVTLAAAASASAQSSNPAESVSAGFLRFLIPDSVAGNFSGFLFDNIFVYLMCGFFLFWLGTYLPDIDSPRSKFGRYFRLPLRHRGWTHSVWPCALFAVLAVRYSLCSWLFLGYTLHILLDFFSAAGICFFYPFQRYAEYRSGAFAVPRHKLKLYRTGSASENRFFAVFLFLCGFVCFFMRDGFSVFFHRTFSL